MTQRAKIKAEHLLEAFDGKQPSETESGQEAWRLYRDHQGGKAFDGSPIPDYEDLRPDIRAAWDWVGATMFRWGFLVASSITETDD